MKQLTSTLLLVFLFSINNALAQTGEQKGWPSIERYNFITECIKSAKLGMSVDSARFYCYCMQEKVEVKYPKIEDADKLTEEVMSSPEWMKEIKACLAGFWSSRDREDFLSNCIASAKEGLGEEKATNYCECMLFKVETKYPVAANAGELTAEVLKTPEWKKIIDGCLKF